MIGHPWTPDTAPFPQHAAEAVARWAAKSEVFHPEYRAAPGCWVWQGATNQQGTAVVRYRGKLRSLTRLAFELIHGELPEGRILRHWCHTEGCWNPEHAQYMTWKVKAREDRRTEGKVDLEVGAQAYFEKYQIFRGYGG